MKKTVQTVIASLLFTFIAACSTTPEPITYTDEMIIQAQVESIDKWARTFTVRMPDGKLMKFAAGFEVKNFEQLEVGDTIESRVYQSVLITIEKEGVPSVGSDQNLEMSEPGEKPGVEASQTYEIRAKIVSIDLANGTVQLKTAAGTVETIKARNPENLKKVEIGDIVVAKVTRGMAIEAKKLQ